ncbi:MAG: PrsW family intramembrane metalloprotease [Corynebacterium sp.]|nr:PrsW family intramembrane metalloprotease [Corynebacterium sp.]
MSRSVDPTADPVRYEAERRRQGKSYDRSRNAAWYHGVAPVRRGFHLTSIRTILIVLNLAALPVLLMTSALYISMVPDSFSIGVLFSILYLLVGTLVFRVSPIWPSAGPIWYIISLLWGGSVSLLFVLLSADSISSLMDKLGLEAVSASFGGAYPEEIAKTFGVLLILFAFHQLNRPWHGFVTGAMVGLGFEVSENILYGGMGGLIDPNSDFDGVLQMWLLRSVFGPGLHVFLTAIAGYAVGYALYTYGISVKQRVGVALAGLGWSFILHFVWNLGAGETYLMMASMGLAACGLYGTAIYLWFMGSKRAKEDPGVIYMHQPVMDVARLPLSFSVMDSSHFDQPVEDGVTLDASGLDCSWGKSGQGAVGGAQGVSGAQPMPGPEPTPALQPITPRTGDTH